MVCVLRPVDRPGLLGGRGVRPMIDARARRGAPRRKGGRGGPPVRHWRDDFPADERRPAPARDPSRRGERPGDWHKRISYWWCYSRAELEALASMYL